MSFNTFISRFAEQNDIKWHLLVFCIQLPLNVIWSLLKSKFKSYNKQPKEGINKWVLGLLPPLTAVTSTSSSSICGSELHHIQEKFWIWIRSSLQNCFSSDTSGGCLVWMALWSSFHISFGVMVWTDWTTSDHWTTSFFRMWIDFDV